jgi:RimJ/RimL family protein N-acetyltransferase
MSRYIDAEAKYSFKNFKELNEQESDEVLQGRNEAEVRRWMTSDRVITPDEHMGFIKSLKTSHTQVYLKVGRGGYFAGVYSLIQMHEGSAVGGFWITDYARQRLLSLSVVFQSINYIFDTLPIETIHGYQLKENNPVAKMNSMLGFRPVATPADADRRMNYLTLTREIWSSQILSDRRLLKLIEIAESRNEN